MGLKSDSETNFRDKFHVISYKLQVVCHQLGYVGAESYSVKHKYGIQDATFRWRNVFCQGQEASLLDS